LTPPAGRSGQRQRRSETPQGASGEANPGNVDLRGVEIANGNRCNSWRSAVRKDVKAFAGIVDRRHFGGLRNTGRVPVRDQHAVPGGPCGVRAQGAASGLRCRSRRGAAGAACGELDADNLARVAKHKGRCVTQSPPPAVRTSHPPLSPSTSRTFRASAFIENGLPIICTPGSRRP
jgi:hypothetical protein